MRWSRALAKLPAPIEEEMMDDTALEHYGFAEVERFLAARGLRHAIVEHAETYTATADHRHSIVLCSRELRLASGATAADLVSEHRDDDPEQSERPNRPRAW
jgi:hypothetical protein